MRVYSAVQNSGLHGNGVEDWVDASVKVYPVLSSGGPKGGGSIERLLGVEKKDEMKVYNAWSGSSYQQIASVCAAPPIRVLTSFAYDGGSKRSMRVYERIAKYVPLETVDMVVDSGAFTAFTSGKVIDLDEYIAWAAVARPLFGEFAMINLDVIPGAPGVRPTAKEQKRAIAMSMENADKIRAAGLPVMEVFHLHDGSFKVMEKLWERRQPGEILGIGGIAGRQRTSLKELDDFGNGVFARVRDWNGGWEGIPKVHGLGISPDAPMSKNWPWWSIDSSSWSIFQRYGRDVASDGRAQRLNINGTMSSVTAVSDMYYMRVVKRWRRLEQSYTTMWEERGVTFANEEVPAT